MNTVLSVTDYEAIAATLQHYIDGAIQGKGELMKPAFHEEASIYGYVGDELFAGPIQKLYDWNDSNGPAPELVTKISKIDIAGTAASARLESENWTGHRFTDFFNLLKIDGQWKIMNKVFHLHHD
ncbi:MAG TPA: nuclear transport factor 2 family protein [Methylophilaceae bacterium]|nr:nuclear transport factor 2 family protein [Methylophilaceae bacterium]